MIKNMKKEEIDLSGLWSIFILPPFSSELIDYPRSNLSPKL